MSYPSKCLEPISPANLRVTSVLGIKHCDLNVAKSRDDYKPIREKQCHQVLDQDICLRYELLLLGKAAQDEMSRWENVNLGKLTLSENFELK